MSASRRSDVLPEPILQQVSSMHRPAGSTNQKRTPPGGRAESAPGPQRARQRARGRAEQRLHRQHGRHLRQVRPHPVGRPDRALPRALRPRACRARSHSERAARSAEGGALRLFTIIDDSCAAPARASRSPADVPRARRWASCARHVVTVQRMRLSVKYHQARPCCSIGVAERARALRHHIRGAFRRPARGGRQRVNGGRHRLQRALRAAADEADLLRRQPRRRGPAAVRAWRGTGLSGRDWVR